MHKLLISLLSLPLSAFALPMRNPSDALLLCQGVFTEGWTCDPCVTWCDMWSFRTGFDGDYVFNRNLETVNGSDIDKLELYNNAGILIFNLWNRFDVFSTFGAGDIFITTPGSAFGNPNNAFVEIRSETVFMWSIGGRLALCQLGCFGLGLDGEYFYTQPDIEFLKQENQAPIYLGKGFEIKYKEWQIGLGASYKINIIGYGSSVVPYAGISWAHVNINMDDDVVGANTLFELESKKHWGYAVGFTFVGCQKTSFTLEGRFADELALHLNAQFRF